MKDPHDTHVVPGCDWCSTIEAQENHRNASVFHESDHEHKWVFSRETFWSEHGGPYCLVWCDVCDRGPSGSEGHEEFPLVIARELAEVHGL